MAVVFASDVSALVMGEIQVFSRLGQALNAEISFADLSADEAMQFKVHLAGIDEYKKMGLAFPDGHKFRFQLVSEQGKRPHIHVSSSNPIDDPFVNLLLEISTLSGKFSKSYTFLLDPPSDFQPAVTVSQSPNAPQRINQRVISEDAPVNVSDETSKAPPRKRVVSSFKPSKPKYSTKSAQLEIGTSPPVRSGNSQMKLTMSMSISKYDPSVRGSDKDSNDALQEELIAKGKVLDDMNVQLAEMKAIINALHNKMSSTNQQLAASGVLVESQVAASEVLADVGNLTVESPKLQVAASAIQPSLHPQSTSLLDSKWLNPILAIVALLLGVTSLLWYRKRQQLNDWQHGPFDDLDDESSVYESPVPEAPVLATYKNKAAEPVAVASVLPVDTSPVAQEEMIIDFPLQFEMIETPVTFKPESMEFEKVTKLPLAADNIPLSFGETTLENPAYTEHKSESPVPPEYTMLLKANRLFRSGNIEQAEEALLAAIKINPMNPYGYVALLGIYEKRRDIVNFAKLAEQLKGIGDESAFSEAAALGRKLDPDNPLYLADNAV